MQVEMKRWNSNKNTTVLTSLATRFSSFFLRKASCFSANNSASFRSCSFLRNACCEVNDGICQKSEDIKTASRGKKAG